ncbi:MAG: acetyl-CoA C-acetyltransferase [Thermoleophilia bacterium]|nr:acetyl-CoA C-acetyltransferase [Thermoleophilia bacterium]
MTEAVIASAVRTPVGTFNGALAGVPAPRLGAIAVRAALERAGVAPDAVEDVLIGSILTAGQGQNPARQAAIAAGIPESVPATTVNMLCGSGLRTVALAAQAVRAGDAEVVVAGGQENMSAAPYLLPQGRTGYRMGHGAVEDSMIRDGLWCALADVHMGTTAENIARELEVSREDQDAFAAESQRRAGEAMRAGRFEAEIVPVEVPQRRGEALVVAEDEHPRPATTTEALARLRPAFADGGTVTAGNASGINDGAAATVVMSRDRAEALGVAPLAAIRSYAWSGVSPRIMGMGPVEAVRMALARAGLGIGDIDLVELNEAFAAQSVAVCRALGIDMDRCNVNGGAIALGHPVGASGARVLTTLLHEMARREARTGLAALCIGGGMGIAMVVERDA